MFDTQARAATARPVTWGARAVDRSWITPDGLTLTGLAVGVTAAVLAGFAIWWAALVLWLLSRVLDALDGGLARRRNPNDPHLAGGFLDITSDFVVYGAFVVGVGVGYGGSLLPFLIVLVAYYVNGAALLAFSAMAERANRVGADGRSLTFLGGPAEGLETIAVHSLWCIFPPAAGIIAWGWSGVVLVTGLFRMFRGHQLLSEPVTLLSDPVTGGANATVTSGSADSGTVEASTADVGEQHVHP